jgi:xylose isomerase
MRYYSDPGFKLGALSHPDEGVRRKALDLTAAGGSTRWPRRGAT